MTTESVSTSVLPEDTSLTTVPSDDDRVAAAMEAIADEPAEEPAADGQAKEAEKTDEAVQVPEPVENEQSGSDPLDELRKQVAEQRAKRAAAAKEKEQQAKLEQLQRQIEEKERAFAERMAKIEAFERDPLEYLEKYGGDPRATYDRLTKLATDPQGERAKSKLEQLESRLEEMRELQAKRESEQRKQLEQEQWRALHQKAQAEFAAYTSAADRFPLTSRLPEQDRIQWGVQIATELADRNEPDDNASVAIELETRLRKLQSVFGASGGAQSNAGSGSGQRASEKSPAKTLTNDLASQVASPTRLLTEQERIEAALRELGVSTD